MAAFERKTLGEVLGERGYIRGPFGSALVRSELQAEGIPVYEQQHAITGTREFRFFVDEEKLKKLSRFKVRPNDLIISCSGTVGRISVIQPDDPMGIISQALLILRPHIQNVLPAFLYYFLSTRDGQHALVQASHGSVQVNIAPRATVEQIELPVPGLGEQRAIVDILGALDSKIELNRQMNETLEAMARALFKSWFLDFDPVRAKVEGRSSGLPNPITDLFPDSFEDSELGEIPKGWEVQRFADTVDIIGGGTPKTSVAEYWGGDIPWFSVVDAPVNSDVWVVDTTKKITREGVENSSTRILPVGTTIISARGTVGRVALVAAPMAMNQSCYGLRGKAGTHGFFTYYATRELVSRLQQHAHGSVFDTITQDTLAGVSLASPPAELVKAFEIHVGPVLERIRENLLGSQTLAAIRDSLLPKLISGELRIKDAKQIAEARA